MDRSLAPRLIEKVNGLAEAYERKPITVKAAEIWFSSLREFDADLVFGLLDSWAKTHTRFPAPADVWKACNDISSDERDKRIASEKAQREREYQQLPRTEYGERMLGMIKEILQKPGCTPIQHWRKVLETEGLPQATYDFAHDCLLKLDRNYAVQHGVQEAA